MNINHEPWHQSLRNRRDITKTAKNLNLAKVTYFDKLNVDSNL